MADMNPRFAEQIIQRLQADYEFRREANGWFQGGKCPDCGKRELYTRTDSPWVIRCGRVNKCGWEEQTKVLYADVFEGFNKRFKPTEKNPNATADAYMQYSRGFDIKRIRGWYEQGRFWSATDDAGTATVRFWLDASKTIHMERFVEEVVVTNDKTDERKKRKAHFRGSHQGLWWGPPGLVIDAGDEVWLVEAVMDAIALTLNGIKAVAVLSCVNYPGKSLEPHQAKDVTWVWALDNDKAGKRWTRKHVKRMRDSKLQATAAQVSHASKRDWNDLHQREELTPNHLKKYRYYGQLLIAVSASEKALLIYKWSERREFHFEFNNRLFWFALNLDRYEKAMYALKDGDNSITDEQAREQALKEANAILEITNCYFRFLYYQANLLTDESWYYARVEFPHGARAVKNTFTGGQLSSSSEFKKRLLSIAAGSVFTGQSNHLDRILKDQLHGIKTVQTVDYIGYSKEYRCYVFNDIAVKDGIIYELNDEDFFDAGKLSIKTLNQSAVLHINTDREQYTTDWVSMLKACFGARGIVALAFWLGSLFAEQIREMHKSFPFIEIIGEPGSGKTTLIEFLWKLVGRRDYEGFDPSKSTLAARARNFAQVANLPIVLIEADREDDKSKGGRFDWDELKTAYNGRSVRSRGLKTSGNETYEPPFRGSIVISQNAEVNASEAVLQRIVHTRFTRAEHTPETKIIAEKLERLSMEQVSGFLLQVLAKEKEILQLVREKTPYYESHLIGLPDLKSVRIAKNHAQIMSLIDALTLAIPLSESDAKSARTTLSKMAIARQKAISADHPVVQEFWEMFDYLNGDEDKPKLNHSIKPDVIAINLNHFVQLAMDKRQQLPPLVELKRHLKSSKTRKYLGQRATKSAIDFASDNEARVVRCWQFDNPETRRAS